jgi:hypothetical protein
MEQFFTKRGIYLRRSTSSDVTLAALLRGECETSRAIVALARSGYGANTLALSRSMVDAWITIRWLTNRDTDSRTRRFLGFDSKQRERIMELINLYYPTVNIDRFVGNKHHDRQAREYPRWDTWGPGIKKMAEEDEVFEDELVGPASPRWAYDIAFFISSYHFHPTSLGLRHHFLQPGDIFSFEQRSKEGKLTEQGLIIAVQCLLQSASRIGRYWGVDAEDTISSLWERYVDPIIQARP